MQEFIDDGSYAAFETALTKPFEQPEGLPAAAQDLLNAYTPGLKWWGDLYADALANPSRCQIMVASGLMEDPMTFDRELFAWMMSEHMFQHESTMHKYLDSFPEAPVPRILRVCAIKPKTIGSGIQFGAVCMEITPGYPMSRIYEACKTIGDDDLFQREPDDIRALIPKDKDSFRRYFTQLNHPLQFPASVGVQSRDPNADNIMCSNNPDGTLKLTWIDVGQFQPLAAAAQHRSDGNPLEIIRSMCLSRTNYRVNDQNENEMYSDFSYYLRGSGFLSKTVQDLKLNRHRNFGSKISMTFAWRLIVSLASEFCWQLRTPGRHCHSSILCAQRFSGRNLLGSNLFADGGHRHQQLA
jgi:hypothetical protein